jgi:hypothetical protein
MNRMDNLIRSGGRHLLPILSLLVLTIPATIYHTAHLKGGERSWWYYDWNDSCQAAASHSVQQRLGAKLEFAVWPGDTLSTPYLYGSLLSARPKVNGNIAAVEKLLADSVYFHWNMAYLYGIAFIWAFFLFLYRLTSSNFLSLFSSCILATNVWYALQVTSVRPEMLSMLWIIAAAFMAISNGTKTRIPYDPILFGILIGLSLYSKLQILPVVPFVLAAYFWQRWPGADYCPTNSYTNGLINISSSVLVFAASFGFFRSDFISGAAYNLPSYPSSTGKIAFVSLLLLLVAAVLLSFSSSKSARFLASGSLRMLGGGILALSFITLPNLVFGGFRTFLASINTLLFGMASYTRYGLNLGSGSGWGFAKSLSDKMDSFVAFQDSHAIPFVHFSGSNNLALVVFGLVAGLAFLSTMHWFHRQPEATGPGKKTLLPSSWAALLLLLAVLFDFALTNRTAVTGAPFGFYHLYTIPFYLLAAAMTFKSMVFLHNGAHSRAADFSRPLLGYLLAIFILLYYPYQIGFVKGWAAAEKDPKYYVTCVDWIAVASPSLFRETATSLNDLKTQIMSHTAIKNQSSQPGDAQVPARRPAPCP